jgi:hypothetical protein
MKNRVTATVVETLSSLHGLVFDIYALHIFGLFPAGKMG